MEHKNNKKRGPRSIFWGGIWMFIFGIIMVIFTLWAINECTNLECMEGARDGFLMGAVIGFIGLMVAGSSYKSAFGTRESDPTSDNLKIQSTSDSTQDQANYVKETNLTDELKEAQNMLEQGLIDEDEYKALKAKIIEKS